MLGLDVGSCEDGTLIPPCAEPCDLNEIAAITFTQKAASELKQKLRSRIEASDQAAELRWEIDNASVGTIHGFCGRLLRDHALRLGIDPWFRVLDEREATRGRHEIIRTTVMLATEDESTDIALLLERLGLHDRSFQKGLISVTDTVLRDIRWHAAEYTQWTRERSSVDEPAKLDTERILDLFDGSGEGDAAEDAGEDDQGLRLAGALYSLAHQALSAWLTWMEEENVRDYDSLILDARRLLTRPEHRAALKSIRRNLKILIIDEFQDTDGAQQDIAFALAGIGESDDGECPQLLLVGDPKQSIYRFRGADISVWNRVRAVLCGGEGPMQLTMNFRTQPGVVGFINDVCSEALESTSADLEATAPELLIPYSPLVAERAASPGEGVDWLDCTVEDGKTSDINAQEARLVVSRIRQLLKEGRVTDPRSTAGRTVRCRDIAVLARTRAGLDLVERGLREVDIQVFNGASLGLSDRQEIIDLLTLLRLFRSPEDDYYGFAFLRSPFVGLRDETIARFRLDSETGSGPLLLQAVRFLHRVDAGKIAWFEAPEKEGIADIEREALRRALSAVEFGQALVDRIPPSELLESALRQTDYRLHLLLRPGADEALASIELFGALLDEHRHLPLASFLDLWGSWGEQDLGVPQAPLYSAADDVVTLQTIHTAKGLEWPIVFLVGAGTGPRGALGGKYISDPHLGPVFMPASKVCGKRAQAIASRELAAGEAEHARLLYVAMTRARDRLILAAPATDSGYMRFLRPHLINAASSHLVVNEGLTPPVERRTPTQATASDPVTRTGGQIEVFDDDSKGQLDIFVHSSPIGPNDPETDGTGFTLIPVVYRSADPIQGLLQRVPVSLDWLDHLETCEMPLFARSIPEPPRSRLTSATELSMRTRDAAAWRLRYVHGVEEAWRFAPSDRTNKDVPAHIRGTLIHGVLERIEALDELAGILNETIAGIDTPPGIDEHLNPGTAYREALEAEISRIVVGEDWHWYVDGEHYRELRFLHLSTGGDWKQGAIDLYRPESGDVPAAETPWVVDFKTHQVSADDVEGVAAGYRVQVGIYRDAVTALAGRTPRVLLHFTHPDVATEV
ncbi:MAG: hypothetical protein E4H28_02970 [Gemmatimonadales bacterium]|nr:MAG: hypothetical protein E4H28_02970 [Gemmatimonadales bacterium]